MPDIRLRPSIAGSGALGGPAPSPAPSGPVEAEAPHGAADQAQAPRPAAPDARLGAPKLGAGGSSLVAQTSALRSGVPAAARSDAVPGPKPGAFSTDPALLAEGLAREVVQAYSFAEEMLQSITFFGGARVRPDQPIFAEGQAWGEAVALMNLGAVSGAEQVAQAAASGLFAPQACRAGEAVALGVTAGLYGATRLAQALAQCGAVGPEATAAALVQLARASSPPEDRALILSVATTGAGPGMMEAVPLGVLEARKKVAQLFPELGEGALARFVTQGSRIQLPFEQETSPTIEKLATFEHFLPRRLALTEAAGAFVGFPGGFGTLNELFEVWRAGRPTVLHGQGFWGGTAQALTAAWRARDLVAPEVLEKLAVVEGPADGLPHILEQAGRAEPVRPSRATGEAVAEDIRRGLAALAKLPTAVTVIGGQRLQAADREVGVAERLAARLARAGVPLRVGGDGAVLDAVSRGAAKGRPELPVQAFLLERPGVSAEAVEGKVEVAATVQSALVHKVLLYENTEAIVALPGGVGTFDEVFEIACLMQTGKIPKRPLILVGREFWQPILDEMAKVMFTADTKLIAEHDMQLFQVVDTEAQAAAALRKHRAAADG